MNEAATPKFSAEEIERAFFWTRDRIAAAIAGAPKPKIGDLGETANRLVLGAFVSLKKRGRLRSCMGAMREGIAWGVALDSAAVSAATSDPRFPPLSPDEFYDLDLEIWALGGMRAISERGVDRASAIQIGRDGLQIEGRGRRGLLLPSVATDFGWDAERFLEAVCEKAGLARDAWTSDETRLFAFEGVSFKKPFVYLASKNPTLAQIVAERNERNGRNKSNGEETAVSVSGADKTISASSESSASASRPTFRLAPDFFRWNLPSNVQNREIAQNNGVSEGVAANDASAAVRPAAVAGLFYPATPTERAALLDKLERTAQSRQSAENAGLGEVDEEGRFGKVGEISKVKEVGEDGRFSEVGEIRANGESRRRWSAALVPHAGWIYSGRLAAATLKRVEIPETVVVFAPKHRAEGADFAVMPAERWDVGGGESVPSDPDFVERFVAAVPPFRKDAVAHRREHAVETLVPLIARRNPKTKVVGAVIGRATVDELTAAAANFAEFLQNEEKSGRNAPLLLISSDMNHFSNDETTRRLDALALDALESLDPTRLWETVRREKISMCGVLPAFFVLTALAKIGKLGKAVKVGYATSGDSSGDRERVVGYAGYLFG
ncbi:MAG: AmmeMemoRadiSam system protein B [Thermoguttaceae bacterium]|nr:AmmeMemoRadiSam system protein B [Thermoguttaceae bacterium]